MMSYKDRTPSKVDVVDAVDLPKYLCTRHGCAAAAIGQNSGATVLIHSSLGCDFAASIQYGEFAMIYDLKR